MMPLIISVLTFFLFTIVAFGLSIFYLQKFLSPELSDVQVRLQRFKNDPEHDIEKQSSEQAKESSLLLKKPSSYSNKILGSILDKFSFSSHLQRMLIQADMSITVDRFVLLFFVIPVVIALILTLITHHILVLFCYSIPLVFYILLKIRRSDRIQKFTKQLPDALNLMTSSLRAGHSFQSGLAVVVEELPDPISKEFRTVANNLNLGIPMKDSLDRLCESMDIPDVRMLATAILVQRESGGNLAEILDKLSYTIRERFKLKGQIISLTGQSRLTGYILGFSPVALFLILQILMPGYTDPLINNSTGIMVLIFASIWQVIGFMFMKRIIAIRV